LLSFHMVHQLVSDVREYSSASCFSSPFSFIFHISYILCIMYRRKIVIPSRYRPSSLIQEAVLLSPSISL
jgi:hypothetical protein